MLSPVAEYVSLISEESGILTCTQAFAVLSDNWAFLFEKVSAFPKLAVASTSFMK
jgi:hypothetical protein